MQRVEKQVFILLVPSENFSLAVERLITYHNNTHIDIITNTYVRKNKISLFDNCNNKSVKKLKYPKTKYV